MDNGIILTRKIWWPLLMTFKSHLRIVYRNRIYRTMYHCVYANIFPSMHDKIVNLSIRELKSMRLSLEVFEVSEDECLQILNDVIKFKYDNDVPFKNALQKTGGERIVNTDYDDFYFGMPRNVYGKVLTKFRDEVMKCRYYEKDSPIRIYKDKALADELDLYLK